MPLSEHEQKVLQELEQALYRQDPAFADRVRSENVYRYAGRYLRWSVLGFVAGLVVMLVFFTTSVLAGFAGVLLMFASLIAFWTNLRRMGRAGWDYLSQSLRSQGIATALNGTRARLRDRFHKGQ